MLRRQASLDRRLGVGEFGQCREFVGLDQFCSIHNALPCDLSRACADLVPGRLPGQGYFILQRSKPLYIIDWCEAYSLQHTSHKLVPLRLRKRNETLCKCYRVYVRKKKSIFFLGGVIQQIDRKSWMIQGRLLHVVAYTPETMLNEHKSAHDL